MKKGFVLWLSITVASLSLSASFPGSVFALTDSERSAIQARLTQLQALLEQKTVDSNTSQVTSPSFRFERALDVGSTGDDVFELQRFLNQNPETRIAASGAGSPGNETRFYGAATKNAVAAFQRSQGIVATGVFTHETRIIVNAQLARIPVSTVQPIDPTTLPLLPDVGMSPDQIPVFSTKAAREQGVFQGNPSSDQRYLKEESARIAKVFSVAPSQVGGTGSNPSYSSDSSASSTANFDNIKNFAAAAVGAIFLRNFSGTIVRPPHFCTCTLTPVIFVLPPPGSKNPLVKSLALYPVPGKTLFMSYNFFTPKVAVVGQYADLYAKAPCLQGFPPACVPDPTVKYIDGFIVRMGTSLLPTKL